MWNPKSLKIVNLFSYQESYFEFVNNQTTMVYGHNKTEETVHSNRSGKTSILDCITIALTGEPLRDIKKAEIVRNGEKSGELEFILDNRVLDKVLKIKWEINSNKSNNALIWINDILDNNLKDLSPKETTDYILKLIGISKEDLINYFLISKDSFQSFFTTGDTAKKEIINRFSKANIIDPVDPLIKGDIDLLESTLLELKNQKAANDGILSHLDEEYTKEKLESSIEKTRALTIKSFEEKKEIIEKSKKELPELIREKKVEINSQESIRDKVKSNIFEIKKSIDSLKVEEEKIESDIVKEQSNYNNIELLFEPKFKKLSDSITQAEDDLTKKLIDIEKKKEKNEFDYTLKSEEINSNIKISESDIKLCEKDIKEQDKIIGEIEKNIADKIDCPKCNHSFILRDKDYDLKKAKKDLDEAGELKDSIMSLIKESELEIIEFKKQLSILQEDKNKKYSILLSKEKELKEESKNKIALINEDIRKLKTKFEKEVEDISTIKNKLKLELDTVQKNINTLTKENKDISIKLVEEESKINELTLELNDLSSKSNQLDKQIIECDKSILEEKKRKYDNDPLKSLEEKIKELTDQNDNLIIEIKSWEETKGSLLEWQTRFKQFKSFLANSSISAIEDMTNFFLGKMKTNLTVLINGYRELANGKLKEEIETLVCRDGLNGERINKFSGEEKCEVNLAAILAFQKIINLSSSTGGLNLLFIDEILESADSKALGYIIKSLIPLEQTIFIITHVSSDTIFSCNKIQVEKVNGISKIFAGTNGDFDHYLPRQKTIAEALTQNISVTLNKKINT